MSPKCDAHVNLRLPHDIVGRLDQIAKDDCISRSLLIRRLLLTGIYQIEELPSGG